MKISSRAVALLLVGGALGCYVRGRLVPLAYSDDGEKNLSRRSHAASINLKEKKLSFRGHFNEQLPRIIFLVAFWGVLAIAVMLMIKSGIIRANTEINPGIEHYLDEKLNLWVALFEVIIFVFVTGIAAIFGDNRFVVMAQEEICRFFYNLGAFIGWMVILIVYFYDHTKLKIVYSSDWVVAPVMLVGYMGLGLLLSWLFKWRLSRLSDYDGKNQ